MTHTMYPLTIRPPFFFYRPHPAIRTVNTTRLTLGQLEGGVPDADAGRKKQTKKKHIRKKLESK